MRFFKRLFPCSIADSARGVNRASSVIPLRREEGLDKKLRLVYTVAGLYLPGKEAGAVSEWKKSRDWADQLPEEGGDDEAPEEPEKPYPDGSAVNECWARDREGL